MAKVFSRPAPAPGARPAASGIRPGLFYGCFALLFGTNVLTLVGLLMAPDVSHLISGQNGMVAAAYEDRIAQLRVEVDRLHSRHYAQTGDINLQLQELTQQQEVLIEQQQLVRTLVSKAAELGIDTARLARDAAEDASGPLAALSLDTERPDLATVAASLAGMMDESRVALAALSRAASDSTATILGELGNVGIRPKMPNGVEDAVGGPLLPALEGVDASSILDEAHETYLAIARFKAAKGAIDLAPIHRPIDAATRQSSTFGNRKDPFTGGRAFHAGVDFAAPKGTVVLSAGYGKVTFVGVKSGYGNVVEVTHAAGLITRYGHLSAFIAREGQTVATGTPIAKVGSTGRSTGPHLHFEVRRKDVAVDPGKYLAVGKRLQRFLGA